MDSLTKTLLTGAAMSALSVAPALAGSHPMLAVKTETGVKTFSGNLHYKTNVHNPAVIKTTVTLATLTYTLKPTTWFKVVADLEPEVIYTSNGTGGCIDYPGQKFKATRDPAAKIKAWSTKIHETLSNGRGGTCKGTLTFYGPAYELRSRTITKDNFQWNDLVKFTTTTTNTRGRRRKHKHDYTARLNFNMNH